MQVTPRHVRLHCDRAYLSILSDRLIQIGVGGTALPYTSNPLNPLISSDFDSTLQEPYTHRRFEGSALRP